ncbi:hypothetical protein BH23BAC1_BH23BAC1_22980 [soil metagenome]
MWINSTKNSIVYIFLFCTLTCFGQNAPQSAEIHKPGTGLWMGLYTKLRFSERAFYYAETHYRRRNSLGDRRDFIGRMGQIYNRHGINFLFNPYFEVTLGPVLVLNYSPQPDNPEYETVTLEPRIWHQWLLIQPQMGRFKFYHQFRFEHRFKRTNLRNSEYKYTDRYRYKIFAYIPLNKSYLGNNTLFLAPSAEIFMHTGKSVVFHPLEDFRVYTGIGYIINQNYMLFGGHMWTIGQNPEGFSYNQSHIIRLNLFINFDLRPTRKTIPKIHMFD